MRMIQKTASSTLLAVCAVIVSLSSTGYAQVKFQPIEKGNIPQTAYSKLSVYNRAANAQIAAETNTVSLAIDDLKFEIRNVHTGPIQEIYERSVGEMIAKPTGDIVEVTPATFRFNGGPEHALYRAEWVRSSYIGSVMEDWEATTIKEMFRLTDKKDVEEYTSYEVTVRLSGRERTYKALILYHEALQSTESPKIDFLDNIVGSFALSKALTDKRPPVKAPWREYVKSQEYLDYVETYRREHPGEIDPDETGRDIEPSLPPTGCIESVTSGSPRPKVAYDYQYHSFPGWGYHNAQSTLKGYCFVDAACNNYCTVSLVKLETNESGVPTSFCHQPGSLVQFNDSESTGNTSTTCSTTAGAAFTACFFCACSVNLEVGPVKTTSSNGFWTYHHQLSYSCCGGVH